MVIFLRKQFGAANIDLATSPHKRDRADTERGVEIALVL